jgi:N,N'-diacetyllegionaminate synthase
LIETAKKCGADVVKFQTHLPEAETIKDAPNPAYFKSESRYDYFSRIAFSNKQWLELSQHCEKEDIQFMSSPFSIEAVDILEKIGNKEYKIPSGEITNIPLLDEIGSTMKPIIISSGMSSWSELDSAVKAVERHHHKITILQCTSEYPCSYENVGLNILAEIKNRYGYAFGLSDHTLSNYASFAAVTMGASTIEKHLTFHKGMYGSDAKHSLDPDEFTDLVNGIRAIDIMKTTEVQKNEMANSLVGMKKIFQKSLVARVKIFEGTKVDGQMVAYKKPGTGIEPGRVGEIVGRIAVRDIEIDEILSLGDFKDD